MLFFSVYVQSIQAMPHEKKSNKCNSLNEIAWKRTLVKLHNRFSNGSAVRVRKKSEYLFFVIRNCLKTHERFIYIETFDPHI